MDNLGNHGSQSDSLDKPIPLPPENAPSSPAPVKGNSAGGAPPISRAPLNLGGTGAAAPANPATRPVSPTPRVQAAPQAPVRRPGLANPTPAGRIANCKTFFTKLHPGAVHFLDEQITGWLKENPGVVIKHTNVVTGDVVDKKTEPNILITIWY